MGKQIVFWPVSTKSTLLFSRPASTCVFTAHARPLQRLNSKLSVFSGMSPCMFHVCTTRNMSWQILTFCMVCPFKQMDAHSTSFPILIPGIFKTKHGMWCFGHISMSLHNSNYSNDHLSVQYWSTELLQKFINRFWFAATTLPSICLVQCLILLLTDWCLTPWFLFRSNSVCVWSPFK